jgi:hypothetical protein
MNQCTEARIVWTIIQIGVSFGPVSQPIPGLMKAVRALECHQESESSAWEGGTASSCHARPADAEQPWYERAVTEAERVQEIVIRSEDRPVELIVRHFAVGGEPAKTVRVRMMGGGLPTDKLAHVSRARSPGMQGPLRVSAENRARRTYARRGGRAWPDRHAGECRALRRRTGPARTGRPELGGRPQGVRGKVGRLERPAHLECPARRASVAR